MSVEEKLEMLERMRAESAKNEYRLHYGKAWEEEMPKKDETQDHSGSYGFRLRLIAALFLFLVFCGLLMSEDSRHKKISEEIMNGIQNDFRIGYNETMNHLEEMFPDFLQSE